MLKIYLQIFGTIALCFILLFNYQVFGQKPLKAKIGETQKAVKALQAQNEVLGNILKFKKHFPELEKMHHKDYLDANTFFASTFSEPLFMGRIQKMIDLSGCETNGVKVGKITNAKKSITYDSFLTTPKEKEKLESSVKAFIDTMEKYTKDSTKWPGIIGPDSSYSKRLLFYKDMGVGKKVPMSMNAGFEVHRFSLTLKGSYNNCKKFLWLVSQNRPFTQVTVQSFAPISKIGQGSARMFGCRVVVLTVVDKNQRMPGAPILLIPTEAKTGAETPAGTEQAKPSETKPQTEASKSAPALDTKASVKSK